MHAPRDLRRSHKAGNRSSRHGLWIRFRLTYLGKYYLDVLEVLLREASLTLIKVYDSILTVNNILFLDCQARHARENRYHYRKGYPVGYRALQVPNGR